MCIPNKKDSEIKPKKHLRIERKKIMESMEIKHNKMLSLIEGWNGEGSVDVKKKDMTEIPLSLWIDVNSKVSIKRLENIGELVVFETLMKKGGEFGLHKHSDCREICEIVSGEIYDLVNNETYSKGDSLILEKDILHCPVALEESILKVYFD